MLFNSFEFLIFFLAFLTLYFSTPYAKRWLIILIGSYIFYMAWKPAFAALIFVSTAVDYFVAIFIAKSEQKRTKALILSLSIAANLGLLFTFKYLDFFISSIVGMSGIFGMKIDLPYAELILPVGISFYTFQTMSYTIDVYRGKIPAERNFGKFASFVIFFPQLLAGPIERASNLLPQISAPKTFNFNDFASGALLAIWGIWKKVCVADLIAPFVNGVYAEPQNFNGSYLTLATVLFAIQIYCDFSGYSDTARGIARMLGYELMLNFRQPYFSTSLSEFWRRWHISLSTWFRDYVYVPLGGNRNGKTMWARNILLVFLISGLWHGAAWTFVIWGLIHGFWLLLEAEAKRLTGNSVGASRVITKTQWLAGLLVTNVIVLVSWVFFRASSLDDAWYILDNLWSIGPMNYGTFKLLHLTSFEIVLLACQIMTLMTIDYVLAFNPSQAMRVWTLPHAKKIAFSLLTIEIAFFGVFDKIEFIYFQF